MIYQLSSLDCILKTGESRRNHCAYAVTRAGGVGGCSGVSDPACPGTTMVSRRWVTSSSSPAPHLQTTLPTLASCSFYGRPLHLNCQLSTRRIQTGAQHIFSMATTFHSLCPFLQKDLVLEFLVLSISCRQKVQNLPSTCRSCALHYFYILFQCHGHSIKNIFVFANFFVESTTYCISWMCYE